MAGSAPNVDLNALLTVQDSIVANAADTQNGVGVDLLGHESAMIIATTQGITGSGGTIVFTAEQSDDNVSFDSDSDLVLSGSFTAATAADRTDTVGIVRSKRYVRVVATKAATVSGGEMYAAVVANASRHL